MVKRRVASQAMAADKDRIAQITRRSGGRSIEQVVDRLQGYMPDW